MIRGGMLPKEEFTTDESAEVAITSETDPSKCILHHARSHHGSQRRITMTTDLDIEILQCVGCGIASGGMHREGCHVMREMTARAEKAEAGALDGQKGGTSVLNLQDIPPHDDAQ